MGNKIKRIIAVVAIAMMGAMLTFFIIGSPLKAYDQIDSVDMTEKVEVKENFDTPEPVSESDEIVMVNVNESDGSDNGDEE